MNVNLKGLFFATQRVLPVMLKQEKGKIINIASASGAMGVKDRSAYSASKGGVINLTRALAVELAPHKINVNAVSPGLTWTPLTEPVSVKAQLLASAVTNIPLGRGAQRLGE